MSYSVENVDWPLLALQKQALGRAIGLAPTTIEKEYLEGLMNMLDSLQDHAASSLGDIAVFGEELPF